MNNVAFDLHSDNVFVRIDDSEGNKLYEKKVVNDLSKILEEIRPFIGEARFVLESTGNWYWLVDGLREAGHQDVTLANALELRAISGAKVKTDVRDARKLAKLLRMGEIPVSYAYPAGKRETRDLLRHRIRLVERRSGCYLMLRSVLRKYNVHGDLSTNGLKRLKESDIDQYPLPGTAKIISRQLIRETRYLRKEAEELEEMLEQERDKEPMVRHLQGIPGIGLILSMTLYYESGDVSRFPTHREYSSHSRVVSGTGNSNKKVCPGRKKKVGSPYLKWAFMQAAIGAAKFDERMAKIKRNYAEKNQGKGRALRSNNTLAHRLAIAVYHMLRKQVPFNERLFFSGTEAGTPGSRMGR